MPKQRDTTSLVKAVATVVREQIAKAVGSLAPRLDAFERRLSEMPAPKDGVDGKSVTAEDVAPLIEHAVSAAVAAIPVPNHGRDGKDGAPGERGLIGERGAPGEKGDAGARGPAGEKGDIGQVGERGTDGAPGLDGKDGSPGERGDKGEKADPGERGEQGPAGRDGVNGKDGAMGERGEQGPAGPIGAPGERGADGLPGKDGAQGSAGEKGQHGEPGQQGERGVPGVDGRSVTMDDVSPVIEAAIAKGMLELERRGMDLIQRCIDRIPKPKDGERGKDGQDALSLEHFSAMLDADGRTVLLTLKDANRTEHAHLKFPVVIDRGVFRDGGPRENWLYEQGDGVTCGGSFWIAQVDDPQGKPGISNHWRLSVKRGRDGKDGKPGEKGDRGAPGMRAEMR